MTRNNLRKILENIVKIPHTFRIYRCGDDKANIRIILPEKLENDFSDLLDMDEVEFTNKDCRRYSKYNSEIKKIVLDCCNQLIKNNFKIISVLKTSIDFSYPKKYQAKQQKYDDSWMDEPISSSPIWEKMSMYRCSENI